MIRATRTDSRPRAREIRASAQAAQMAMGVVAFCIFFVHMGYDAMPHLMVAMALCVSRAGEAELRCLGPRPEEAPVGVWGRQVAASRF